DGQFYALDARSGHVRWQRNAGGKISGSATIVGDVVYISNLARRWTYGFGVRSGKRVFAYPRGGFNPIATDAQTIHLLAYASLYAFGPRSAKLPAAARHVRRNGGSASAGVRRARRDARERRRAQRRHAAAIRRAARGACEHAYRRHA